MDDTKKSQKVNTVNTRKSLNLLFMKNLLIIIVFMIFTLSCKEANEKFVTLCKESEDLIRIGYLDFMHGISRLNSIVKNDTLEIIFTVTFNHKQKIRKVKVERSIKYIKVGEKIIEMKNIPVCAKIYSGKEVIDQLKKLQNDNP